MRLKHNNNSLIIRQASKNDALYIHKYRSESGENISLEKIKTELGPETMQYMIEADNKIIGDIHYGNVDGNGAEIGIYIRNENERRKGYGTLIITVFSDYLFNGCGYDKIVFNTSYNNESMRHICENKFGLKPNIYNAFQVVSDTEEICVEYELKKENWNNIKINYEIF